jgi:hypothetical protein
MNRRNFIKLAAGAALIPSAVTKAVTSQPSCPQNPEVWGVQDAEHDPWDGSHITRVWMANDVEEWQSVDEIGSPVPRETPVNDNQLHDGRRFRGDMVMSYGISPSMRPYMDAHGNWLSDEHLYSWQRLRREQLSTFLANTHMKWARLISPQQITHLHVCPGDLLCLPVEVAHRPIPLTPLFFEGVWNGIEVRSSNDPYMLDNAYAAGQYTDRDGNFGCHCMYERS